MQLCFDFEAAFPSVDHSFILDTLIHRGWPEWITRLMEILYWSNCCRISVGGASEDGFCISAGVRQGCPLSPLIFSVISDVLLRRITRLLPRTVLRVYADDLAIVLPNGPGDLGTLEDIFSEYACISRLRLHHGKSVWIPLSGKSHDTVRDGAARRASLA